MHIKFDWHLPQNLKQALPVEGMDAGEWQTFIALTKQKEIGFWRLPDEKKPIEMAKSAAKKFQSRMNFFHVGIGGSALGPECLMQALPQKSERNIYFLNNIDPDHTHSILEKIKNPKDCVFYIVSKSGTTAETMAAFAIITSFLKEKFYIAPTDWKDVFVFCTDPNRGDLRQIANDHQITCLDVPSDVGGRFSVLTSVGLFPAAWAGHNVDKLMSGASEWRQHTLDKGSKSDLAKLAMLIFNLSKDHHINQTVVMPYSSSLKNFSSWFVQLWAESLGKKLNRQGKIVHTGLTPIASYGATDQHSQMQLFMEGPFEKLTFFIEVSTFRKNLSLKGTGLSYDSLRSLASFSLQDLLKAELEGTLSAMKEADRPWIRLQIATIGESELGAMFLFYESLTALVGQLLNIDPFDQPGVEAGKKYAYLWLSQISR